MPSIRIRGDYRFRAFINLIVFKIAYTKTGTVDREFDYPLGVGLSRNLRIPGPFDIFVSVTDNQHMANPVARVAVHPDGMDDAVLFSWTQPLEASVTVPVQVPDLRNGNHFHGSIEFKL
jgi:hypothetical protein